jgi:hypothetical protein
LGQVLKVKIIILLLLTTCGLAGVHRVPSDYPTIQAGIDASANGDTVLVAPGTYTGDGNRDIDFKGKAITVKSENGPQTCIIDCNSVSREWHQGFFFRSSEDCNSVLSGFTITKGRGIICKSGSSPTIIDCWIGESDPCTVEYLHTSGPGIVCFDHSNPTIIKCSIVGNVSWDGAGIACHDSDPNIINCLISSNVAIGAPKIIILPGTGGGIFCTQSNPTITNSIIVNNRADCGGGIYCENSDPIIKNCLIMGNGELVPRRDGRDFAIEGGGGIHCDASSPTIINCTLVGNVNLFGRGGAIYSFDRSNPIIHNCILWANLAEYGNQIALGGRTDWDIYSSTATVTYSDIQGGQAVIEVDPNSTLEWGPGNIDIDPFFADFGYWASANDPNQIAEPNDTEAFWICGDYHLKSQAGRWDPKTQSWVIDDVTSPCIDTGNPKSPIGLEPFPNGGRINMGAYGGTIEASKSYFGEPLCETVIAGDINGDCKVDFTDFVIMASHWFEER